MFITNHHPHSQLVNNNFYFPGIVEKGMSHHQSINLVQWKKPENYRPISVLPIVSDDTVIYFSEKHIDTINSCINKDMEILSQFCSDNELILNMKKGKTESILFGTAPRLKGKGIEIRYRGELINSAERYTYLGNIFDPPLTLNDDFQTNYKNTPKRINLLIKMKPNLTENAVKKMLHCYGDTNNYLL